MNTLNNRFIFMLFCTVILASCERQAPTELRGKRPNILLVIADDISYPHMGAYGTKWVKTPAFDMIAEQGILFGNCYTPNAKCAPSRAVLLTGRNSWQLEEAANHIGFWPQDKYPTFCEVLQENGYAVGFTGKGWAPGNPGNKDGERRLLTGKPYQKRKLVPPTKMISPNDYAANFADFLADVSQNEPWMFWVGGHEPHRAYEFGTGVSVGGASLSDIDQVPSFWPDSDTVRHDMLDYALEINHFDTHL